MAADSKQGYSNKQRGAKAERNAYLTGYRKTVGQQTKQIQRNQHRKNTKNNRVEPPRCCGKLLLAHAFDKNVERFQ